MDDIKCLRCDTFENVTMQQFAWDCRPRLKDLKRGHKHEMTVFYCYLCNKCYDICEGITVIGWDWWDATDAIAFS